MKAATTYSAILGRVITRLREDKGISREDMCKRLSVSISTWSRIERGDAAGISIDQVTRIAEVLGTTPGKIFERADKTQKKLKDEGMEVYSQPAKKVSATAKAGVALVGLAALTALVTVALKNDDDNSS